MSKNQYQNITDKELLEKYTQTRNSEWLGILLQRYTLALFGVCIKYLKDETDAKDAVQQIFLKVIQEVNKYSIGYFKSWLYMVAKNYCLTILRNKKGKMHVELTDNYDVKQDAPPQQNDVPDDVLKTALQELNKEQQECINLFYLQKKSYQEVSEYTGYNLLQVKSYIQNGKRNLRINIEKKLKIKNV